jgi:hypothetical protein
MLNGREIDYAPLLGETDSTLIGVSRARSVPARVPSP